MVQILPEVPSFGTQIARGLGAGISSGIGGGLEFIKEMALEKQKQASKQKEDKAIEKERAAQGLRGTVDKIRSLVGKAGTGLTGNLNYSEEARYNRGMIRTLSSDLLSFYKSLFPRGITQEEFKRLERDYIPGKFDTDSEMLGKLDAFEDLINRRLSEGEAEGQPSKKTGKANKVLFNPKNPEHKAKAEQLHKKFKDRERVRQELKREFEGLDVG